MKILVTGHAGFVGRHTVSELVAKNHKVIGFDRNARDVSGLGTGGRVESIQGDITEAKEVLAVFKAHRPEAVLHLAANASLQRSVTNARYDAMQNVLGTVNIIGAAQRHGCGRIVFASTSAVYGYDEPMPLRESMEMKPESPYGVSKAAGEMYCRISGISWAALRYGNVYGPGQRPLGENILIARALAHMLDGAIFRVNGDGENERDWVYVRDVVAANLMALESDAEGPFNVSTGTGVTVNKIVAELKAITGHRHEILYGPAKPGELRRVVMSPTRIHDEIGWGPVTHFKMGLAMTAKAWRQPFTVWPDIGIEMM